MLLKLYGLENWRKHKCLDLSKVEVETQQKG